MKFAISLATLLLAFAQGASASSNFTGKCARQAVDAAVAQWADVPEPSESLEYFPVSAHPAKPGSAEYIVVLGISDLNDMILGKYKVVFRDYARCKGAVASQI